MKIDDNRPTLHDFYYVSAGEVFEWNNKFYIKTSIEDRYEGKAVCLKNGKIEDISACAKVTLLKVSLNIIANA